MIAADADADADADVGLREELVGGVLTLTIDRPEQRNALSTSLLAAIAAAFARADADAEVRCAVIAGSDRVFASGADLSDLRDADPLEHYTGPRVAAWGAIHQTRTPMVAAVSGFCLGGGLELAMSCDVIIASETARLGLPETMLGLIPAAGGTQRLPGAIGPAKALDVILTGRQLTAAEAEQAGLVSRVVPASGWLETARTVAQEIARRAPMAQLLAKDTVRAAGSVSLEHGLELERRAFVLALGSPEAREGIEAFLTKRAPCWHTTDPTTPKVRSA